MKITRAEYLANPRSAALRTICIELADVTWKVMQGQRGEDAMVRWDELMDGLRSEGIVAEMNTGMDEAAYTDPVTAAEYIAGQWLSLVERTNNRALLIQASQLTEDRALVTVDPAYTLWRYSLEWFAVQREEMP